MPRFDVLVTGPHATADMPEELMPHIVPSLTRRSQYDFSDVTTSAIGRRWAEIDERVLYVENPHARLVLDPNRPPPRDLRAELQEAFRRVHLAGPGRAMDLDGVDAVRPVTFAFQPVLREPVSSAGWRELTRVLRICAMRGAGVYIATRDHLLRMLLNFHRRSVNRTPMLHVISLHDTMAARIRPNGAITDERPPLERPPFLISLGNRGDVRGEPVSTAGCAEAVTMAPRELRRVTAAFRAAAGIPPTLGGHHVAMNRVYRGGWETIIAGAKLRRVRSSSEEGETSRCKIGAYMAEFAREALLDDTALAVLRGPGTDWPANSPTQVNQIASLLKATYDNLRAD